MGLLPVKNAGARAGWFLTASANARRLGDVAVVPLLMTCPLFGAALAVRVLGQIQTAVAAALAPA